MSRCPAHDGAGDSLGCCRVVGHDDTGTDAAGHCWHWSARLHGTGPHTIVVRAGAGHPMACTTGTALDATPA